MAPKRATISFAFLSLSLTLTLSLAAAHNGCPGDTVAHVLKHYGLPTGLFPDYVHHFSCHNVSNTDALMLSIQLKGVCKVAHELFGVGNLVVCKPHISAMISHKQLTDIKGVTVTLTFQSKPVGDLMTITEAKVVKRLFHEFLQFNSDKGTSPWFPVDYIPSNPPKCDYTGAFDYTGSDGVVVAKNNQDFPIWVYKYGRLLPLEALVIA